MGTASYIKREIVIEGRSKFLVDIIHSKGLNMFIHFAVQNRIPINMVDTALKSSGLLLQNNGELVYLKAMEYYRGQMTALHLENNYNGFGVKEVIKKLGNSRYRASLLVDSQLNLMPEVLVNKTTGMFVMLPETQAAQCYQNATDVPIYQVMCHPCLNGKTGMYVVDIEQQYEDGVFKPPAEIEFYQPTKIDPTKGLNMEANGLLTTTVPCRPVAKTAMMRNCTSLIAAIEKRVALQLFNYA